MGRGEGVAGRAAEASVLPSSSGGAALLPPASDSSLSQTAMVSSIDFFLFFYLLHEWFFLHHAKPDFSLSILSASPSFISQGNPTEKI
jgi:hypothetical protein